MSLELPSHVTPEQAASKLLEARDYIREKGWAQGSYEVEPERRSVAMQIGYTASDNGARAGAVCAVGAMSSACGYRAGMLYHADEWMLGAFASVLGIRTVEVNHLIDVGLLRGDQNTFEEVESAMAYYYDSKITEWNDRDGRTIEEVVIAFEQAAASVKDEGGDGGSGGVDD